MYSAIKRNRKKEKRMVKWIEIMIGAHAFLFWAVFLCEREEKEKVAYS